MNYDLDEWYRTTFPKEFKEEQLEHSKKQAWKDSHPKCDKCGKFVSLHKEQDNIVDTTILGDGSEDYTYEHKHCP